MPSKERGYAIRETVSAMNFEYHLKVLARDRDRRAKRKKKDPSTSLRMTECKKKEADTAATVTTSRGFCGNKTYSYCSIVEGECQGEDTSSTASGPPSPRGEGLRGAVCRE